MVLLTPLFARQHPKPPPGTSERTTGRSQRSQFTKAHALGRLSCPAPFRQQWKTEVPSPCHMAAGLLFSSFLQKKGATSTLWVSLHMETHHWSAAPAQPLVEPLRCLGRLPSSPLELCDPSVRSLLSLTRTHAWDLTGGRNKKRAKQDSRGKDTWGVQVISPFLRFHCTTTRSCLPPWPAWTLLGT